MSTFIKGSIVQFFQSFYLEWGIFCRAVCSSADVFCSISLWTALKNATGMGTPISWQASAQCGSKEKDSQVFPLNSLFPHRLTWNDLDIIEWWFYILLSCKHFNKANVLCLAQSWWEWSGKVLFLLESDSFCCLWQPWTQ